MIKQEKPSDKLPEAPQKLEFVWLFYPSSCRLGSNHLLHGNRFLYGKKQKRLDYHIIYLGLPPPFTRGPTFLLNALQCILADVGHVLCPIICGGNERNSRIPQTLLS